MINERLDNVWDAFEDKPEETENMKLRSALMLALKQRISRKRLNQSQAAKHFGVAQPRVSDLMRGKINLFGLETLVNMAAAAGLRVELSVRDAAQASPLNFLPKPMVVSGSQGGSGIAGLLEEALALAPRRPRPSSARSLPFPRAARCCLRPWQRAN
ncbi:MAG TPA: XRE family transcriptional regulator [Methylocystis sp.]|nr:XRE family transcriptional regulator [Methylocystis sp.]